MNISDLGAVGDFVGAIGVLITLGYLTYQVRQTNQLLAQSRAAQTAAMVQANMGLWQNLYGKILESSETATLYRKLRDEGEVDPSEYSRMDALLVMWVLALENLTFQSKLNPFVENTDEVLNHIYRQNVVAFMRSRSALLWWRSGRRLFGPEVAERIDCALEQEGICRRNADGIQ